MSEPYVPISPARMLASSLAAKARAAGLGEAEVIGLAQAYTRGIGRIVAAESHVLSRAMAGVPAAQRYEWAQRWLAEVLPLTGPTFEELHAAQLDVAVNALVLRPDEPELVDRTIAFVDLCGSTDYMVRGSHDQIRGLADEVFFASRAAAELRDVAVAKHLGDGVLLVSPDRAEMLDAVTELVNRLGRETPLQASAGIAFGAVTTRAGDHFGPPVNLASRLAEVASAREILVSSAAAPKSEVEGTWETRNLRGVAQPQTVLRLAPAS